MKVSRLIPNKVSRKVARQALILKKNSPHIFFGVGVVGVVTSTVLACRATLKLGPVLDEMRSDIQAVKTDLSPDVAQHPDYTFEDSKKDLAYAYLRGSAQIVKLYAPSVVIMGVSVAALTGSHVTLTRRNSALTVAYAGLQKAYEDYRDRVREEYGVEKELDIYHAVHMEKGKEDGKNVALPVADPNKFSPYARFFDEASPNWHKDPEVNRLFVQCQQNYLNHLLHARGHVFLNEAYDALGIDRSSAGQVVGWVISDNGDNYIDFGIFEAFNSRFVNGYERSILLDFNVDGVVYDKIG